MLRLCTRSGADTVFIPAAKVTVKSSRPLPFLYVILPICTLFGGTYTKIETVRRRLAWPLLKDDTQDLEAFHIFVPVAQSV